MALNIYTNFPEVMFSSQFADIVVTTDADSADVELFADGEQLHAERYYTYGGRTTVRDLRSLLENYCESQHKVAVKVQISVSNEGGDRIAASTQVLYCPMMVSTSAMEFANKHFLTTRTAKVMPRHRLAVDYLWVLSIQSESCVMKYYITFTLNGQLQTITYYDRNFIAKKGSITMLPVRYSDLMSRMSAFYSGDLKVLAVTMQVGERSMTYYIMDYHPQEIFLFANAFGCYEIARLDCETTAKTESDRSVAVINGRSEFYNREHTKEYEVQSAPLTMEQARWIEQMFTSYDVRRITDESVMEDDDFDSWEPILITDYTSEVSDTDEEPSRVKFTWQYAFNRPYLALGKPSLGAFSQQFSKSFD